VNVNYVFGVGATAQTWMAPGLWLALLMVALPLLIYLPTHLLLRAASARRGRSALAPAAALVR
jgi:hypothetical protein